jgi:hypothetical protein
MPSSSSYNGYTSRNVFSYQVPKEVGKVGTESQTFIEPIANRKNGIQALFSRQRQAQSSPTKNMPQKRKRSMSPSTPPVISDSVETGELSSIKLKEKTEQEFEDITCSPIPRTRVSMQIHHFETEAVLILIVGLRNYATDHVHWFAPRKHHPKPRYVSHPVDRSLRLMLVRFPRNHRRPK